MAEGLLFYFPDALACVANVSKRGNDQHNPGQPLHHARGKSTDHADCIIRHLAHAGQRDSDGVRETAKAAWRSLALLQEEIERDCGIPIPRNAKAQREWEQARTSSRITPMVDDLPEMCKAIPNPSIRDAGEFTQPPNCSPGVSESQQPRVKREKRIRSIDFTTDPVMVEYMQDEAPTSTHPMAAEALRIADEDPCNQPPTIAGAVERWANAWALDPTYQKLVRN